MLTSTTGLSTIHLYIILKPELTAYDGTLSLSTIHLYIILKLFESNERFVYA